MNVVEGREHWKHFLREYTSWLDPYDLNSFYVVLDGRSIRETSRWEISGTERAVLLHLLTGTVAMTNTSTTHCSYRFARSILDGFRVSIFLYRSSKDLTLGVVLNLCVCYQCHYCVRIGLGNPVDRPRLVISLPRQRSSANLQSFSPRSVMNRKVPDVHSSAVHNAPHVPKMSLFLRSWGQRRWSTFVGMLFLWESEGMMTIRIVPARSFFVTGNTNKVIWYVTDWLVCIQKIIRTKCYTHAWKWSMTVAHMTKSQRGINCTKGRKDTRPSQTDVIFVVIDVLENIFMEEILVRTSWRRWCSITSSILVSLELLLLTLLDLVLLVLSFFGCSGTIVFERLLTNGHEDNESVMTDPLIVIKDHCSGVSGLFRIDERHNLEKTPLNLRRPQWILTELTSWAGFELLAQAKCLLCFSPWSRLLTHVIVLLGHVNS